MKSVYDAKALDTQIKYLKSIFDIGHCYKQYKKISLDANSTSLVPLSEVEKALSSEDQKLANAICKKMMKRLETSEYDSIDPIFFSLMFPSQQ